MSEVEWRDDLRVETMPTQIMPEPDSPLLGKWWLHGREPESLMGDEYAVWDAGTGTNPEWEWADEGADVMWAGDTATVVAERLDHIAGTSYMSYRRIERTYHRAVDMDDEE